MLDPKDAIRIEYNPYGIRHNTRKNYIFKCKTTACPNETRVLSCDLKHRSGLCRNCARRGLPFESSYNHLLYSAKINHPDIEHTLTYEQFLFLTQIGTCHYCGSSDIVWNAHKGADTCIRSNLDRKDNTLGYTFENVVVCCKTCNAMKRDWLSYEEFKAVRLLLKRWREGSEEDRQEIMYDLVSINMKIW